MKSQASADRSEYFGAGGTAARALLSEGTSGEAIYRAVQGGLAARGAHGGVLVDVGAGAGALYEYVKDLCREYWALDAVQYEGLPSQARFVKADLDRLPVDLPQGCADVVAAIEVVEHLENPRALFRELVRLARPDALIVVSTPNQASLLSVCSLLVKQRFAHFSDSNYPAHLTALLPVDLLRIAGEVGLAGAELAWTGDGRMPGTTRHWTRWMARSWPRLFSDNVLLFARNPR